MRLHGRVIRASNGPWLSFPEVLIGPDSLEQFVKTCLVCQQDKVERQKTAGLLEPLPIPKKPWVSLSMDFITGLPKVKDFGSIMVVVDRFSKYASFIPAPHACTAEVAADLFFRNVCCKVLGNTG